MLPNHTYHLLSLPLDPDRKARRPWQGYVHSVQDGKALGANSYYGSEYDIYEGSNLILVESKSDLESEFPNLPFANSLYILNKREDVWEGVGGCISKENDPREIVLKLPADFVQMHDIGNVAPGFVNDDLFYEGIEDTINSFEARFADYCAGEGKEYVEKHRSLNKRVRDSLRKQRRMVGERVQILFPEMGRDVVYPGGADRYILSEVAGTPTGKHISDHSRPIQEYHLNEWDAHKFQQLTGCAPEHTDYAYSVLRSMSKPGLCLSCSLYGMLEMIAGFGEFDFPDI